MAIYFKTREKKKKKDEGGRNEKEKNLKTCQKDRKKKYRNPAGKPLKDYTQFFFLGIHTKIHE